MKTIIAGLLLLCAAQRVAAQAPKPYNPFLGRWRMISFLKNTANPVDSTKQYDFRDDTTLIMTSARYKLSTTYKFDPKSAVLTVTMAKDKEMKFEIIFISQKKMQWHIPGNVDHGPDGIIERIKDYNE